MMSLETRIGCVYSALVTALPADSFPWIRETFDDAVVYQVSGDPAMYRRTYKWDKRRETCTFGEPEKVRARTTYEAVQKFTRSEGGAIDGFVEYSGLIFKAGVYGDKGTAYTPDDVKRLAASVTNPLPMNLEHSVLVWGTPTILGDKLGHLVEAKATDDGDLIGLVRVPEWLDKLVEPPIGVSVEIDLEAMTLIGMAYTLSPRVSDAAIQALSTDVEPVPAGTRQLTKPKGGRMNIIQKVAALFSGLPADADPAKIRVLYNDDPVNPDPDPDKDVAPTPETKPEPNPKPEKVPFAHTEMLAEMAKLRAQNDAVLAGAVTTAANTFASGVVSEGKAPPATKPNLVELYRVAIASDGAKLDAETGLIVEGDAVKQLRATFASMPKAAVFGSNLSGLSDDPDKDKEAANLLVASFNRRNPAAKN